MFNRKFSSNIRRKKRMIISTIILLVVCLGLGYAVFTTNLSINGTLNVSKYDQTLYGVLENAAKKGTSAKEYTGNHQDSIAGVGSEKIYHWYAPDTTAGNTLANEILNKNNVIFANHCWQMIRTTDTGGVKMVYNGEPENNQCLNTRGNHVGYTSRTTQSMSTTYYYGTSYTYDSTNNVFSLDGTITTGTVQTGQYTCKQTTSTGTCSTLYLVDLLETGTRYNTFSLKNNSNYSQFGTLPFNQNYDSPAYAGYMYNTVYPTVNKTSLFSIAATEYLSSNITYDYSDTISYNSSTNTYTLINPIPISTLSDYNTLVGKYINWQISSEIRYVVAVDNDKIYLRRLNNGDIETSLTVGDSYTKSGNTYTLINPTNISYIDWNDNTSDYSVYKGKYVCDGNNTSCSNIKRIITSVNPSDSNYYYYDSSNEYSYAENISYSNGTYTLSGDTKTFWDILDNINQSYLPTHHYTCFENGLSCTKAGYILETHTFMYYVEFVGTENISTALVNMLSADDVNQTNSIMKKGIDAWYNRYMAGYTSKLEDTIFCNDRSITSLGAWNPNGGVLTPSGRIKFKNYTNNGDLSCTNMTDKFSLANEKAQLTFPVGLLTSAEMNLLGNNNINKTGLYYWLLSPYMFSLASIYNMAGYPTGASDGRSLQTSNGVRPVVSLTPGIEYTSGSGSMADPYVIQAYS